MSLQISYVSPESINPAAYNPRTIDEASFHGLVASVRTFGLVDPLIVNQRTGNLVGGHQRLKAALHLKLEQVPVVFVDVDEATEKALNVSLNNPLIQGKFSDTLEELLNGLKAPLGGLLDELRLTDLPSMDMRLVSFEVSTAPPTQPPAQDAQTSSSVSLEEKFLVPPFSVLDARQGYWQARKRAWLSLGIQSEVGRGDNLLGMSNTILEPDPEKREEARKLALKATPGGHSGSEKSNYKSFGKAIQIHAWAKENGIDQVPPPGGTSIFDPVLSELAYRWFSPASGLVLDPFAGGSVRGVVASKLGRRYIGIELRPEQVEANKAQALSICQEPPPEWICESSVNIPDLITEEVDFIFSCPPYADLEVYSDDPRDLSNMEYSKFLGFYRDIIQKAVDRLKTNRFACFVVGEVREKKGGGFYRSFVPDTIKAFEDAGARFYNEGILVTPVGTLALRASRIFLGGRKLAKAHQNVLLFCKGDPNEAMKACGKLGEYDLPFDVPEESVGSDPTEYGEVVTSIGEEGSV